MFGHWLGGVESRAFGPHRLHKYHPQKYCIVVARFIVQTYKNTSNKALSLLRLSLFYILTDINISIYLELELQLNLCLSLCWDSILLLYII